MDGGACFETHPFPRKLRGVGVFSPNSRGEQNSHSLPPPHPRVSPEIALQRPSSPAGSLSRVAVTVVLELPSPGF